MVRIREIKASIAEKIAAIIAYGYGPALDDTLDTLLAEAKADHAHQTSMGIRRAQDVKTEEKRT